MAAYFLDAVEEYDGCPVDLVTDLGTEMELLQPYSLFSEMTQIAIDMCHNLETNALRLGGTS